MLCTGAHFLDPEFIKDAHQFHEKEEFKEVLLKIAQTPHCPHKPAAMVVQWAARQTALLLESHGLNELEAFSKEACGMPSFEWARAFLSPWPAIQWVALRLTSLACSASGCEHSWSIEAWVHSKKRNPLRQTNVERLVRVHTNLALERTLDNFVATALPWEIELIIEEPECDAEVADGAPALALADP